jgi:protocatechuate 3,4-dioxygenase alpha subunit
MTTPSQTVGPFFAVPGALCWPDGALVVAERTPGAFTISGLVLDGERRPVPDALVETWQADPSGRFEPGGFGRCPTDAEGRWAIRTVKPGALPTPDGGVQAPHIDVSVFARGLLQRLVTRIYFPDEAGANAADPVLAGLPSDLRRTLVARPDGDGLRFDVHLQGPDETVFFAV